MEAENSFTKKINDFDVWFTYTDNEWNILMKYNDKTYEINTNFSPYLKTCYYIQVRK